MSPLNLASTGVRNHMKGGGGNVPFLVTGAENFVKKGRPSPWAEGLKAVLAKVSQKTGDSSYEEHYY